MSERRHEVGRPIACCGPCGKLAYISRRAARKARRQTSKGAELSAYPCPVRDQWWHLGHLLDHEHGRDRLRAAKRHAAPLDPACEG